MTIHQNKNNFYYLFLSYFLLFGLINLEYFHLSLNYLYDDSYINRLKFLRSLIPFWIILQFLIIKFIFKVHFKTNIILNLLLFYVGIQFGGFLLSDINPLFNIFYLFLYFSSLLLFYQIYNLNLNQIIYIFYTLIIILLILFLIFFTKNFYLYLTTDYFFYAEYPYVFRAETNPSLFNPSEKSFLKNNSLYQPIFDEPPPRSSGLSRIALIISLFILINLKKKNKFNFIFYILIIYLNLAIFLSFSRTSIISLFILSSFIIFLFKTNLKIKLLKLLIIILVPFILANYFEYSKKNNNFPFNNSEYVSVEKNNSNIDENIELWFPGPESYAGIIVSERSETFLTLTGRPSIWLNIINKTKNKWYIGNGPQADRYISNEKNTKINGQSASNLLFYAFSSGGIFSCLIFLYIYLIFLKKIILIFLQKKIHYLRDDLILFSSFIIIVFLFLRSIMESSFSVFGIDYLVFLTAAIVFEKKYKLNFR